MPHRIVKLALVGFCVSGTTIHASDTNPNCPHWSYNTESDYGPEHWGKLCPEFYQCAGPLQSPIDIVPEFVSELVDDPVSITYHQQRQVEVWNEGHTVRIDTRDEDLHLAGAPNILPAVSTLYQFHSHAPSDHTIDGMHYPLEIHFVHRFNGGLVVLAVFVVEGVTASPFLESWDQTLSQIPKTGNATLLDIDLVAGLPAGRDFYTYTGSLTTPPCDGPVTWVILKDPVVATAEQVQGMANTLHYNNRPRQPANGRVVRMSRARAPEPEPLSLTAELLIIAFVLSIISMVIIRAACHRHHKRKISAIHEMYQKRLSELNMSTANLNSDTVRLNGTDRPRDVEKGESALSVIVPDNTIQLGGGRARPVPSPTSPARSPSVSAEKSGMELSPVFSGDGSGPKFPLSVPWSPASRSKSRRSLSASDIIVV